MNGVHSPSSVSSEVPALVSTLWPDLAVHALLDILWSGKYDKGRHRETLALNLLCWRARHLVGWSIDSQRDSHGLMRAYTDTTYKRTHDQRYWDIGRTILQPYKKRNLSSLHLFCTEGTEREEGNHRTPQDTCITRTMGAPSDLLKCDARRFFASVLRWDWPSCMPSVKFPLTPAKPLQVISVQNTC